MTAFRGKMGKFGNVFDRPAVQRTTAWVGLLGFLIGMSSVRSPYVQIADSIVGITSFLVIRMWFGKAVEDFNRDISKGGSDAPQLIAATSNGFVSTYISLHATLVMCLTIVTSGLGRLCVLRCPGCVRPCEAACRCWQSLGAPTEE